MKKTNLCAKILFCLCFWIASATVSYDVTNATSKYLKVPVPPISSEILVNERRENTERLNESRTRRQVSLNNSWFIKIKNICLLTSEEIENSQYSRQCYECELTVEELELTKTIFKQKFQLDNKCFVTIDGDNCRVWLSLIRCAFESFAYQYNNINDINEVADDVKQSSDEYKIIEVNYNSIKSEFNDKYSKVRSKLESVSKCQNSHINRPKRCEITEKELTSSVANGVITSQLQFSSTCFPSTNDNCLKWSSWINCIFDALIEKYKTMSQRQESTFDDYDKLAKVAIKLENEFEKFSQKINFTPVELPQKMVKINAISSKLAKCIVLIKREREDVVQGYVTKIHNGKVESAVNEFKTGNLHEYELVEEIIAKTFSQSINLTATVINLLNFISQLTDVSQRSLGYTKIYEMMKGNDLMNYPLVFLIQEQILNEISKLPQNRVGFHSTLGFTALRDKLEVDIKYLIEMWGKDVRRGDYFQIQLFSNQFFNQSCVYLPEIIKAAYDEQEINALKVLQLIKTMPKIRLGVIGYPVLFEEMRKINELNGFEILMLAYKVKQLLGNPGQAATSEVEKLRKTNEQIPTSIKTLIWNSHVVFESKIDTKNYLGVMKDKNDVVKTCPTFSTFNKKWDVTIHEEARYFQFTNQGTNLLEFDKYKLWEVNAVTNGNSFYLKSKSNSRILDANDKSINSSCSNVYAHDRYTSGDHQKWQIYKWET